MRRTYGVTGTIIGVPSRVPLAGWRIEAWDRDLLLDDSLGATTSDQAGRFAFEIDPSRFIDLFFDQRPDVFFRVFDGGTLVRDTRHEVWRNLDRHHHDIVLEIPTPVPNVPPAPELTDDDLLALHDAITATPDQLAARSPELYRQLVAIALAEVRRRLARVCAGYSPALRAYVAQLDLRPISNPSVSVGDVMRERVAVLEEPVRTEALAAASRRDLPTFAEILRPTAPIGENPVFAPQLGDTAMLQLGGGLKLDPETIARLRTQGVRPQDLDRAKLTGLVAAGVLDARQAEQLGTRASLYRAADREIRVVESIAASFEAKTAAPLTRFRDVAVLSRSDLAEAIRRSGSQRSVDKADALAEKLARMVELLFPDDVLRARLQPLDANALSADLAAAAPLVAKQPRLFTSQTSPIDASGVETGVIESIDRIRRIAMRYPGLGEVFESPKLPLATKVERALRRAQLLPYVLESSPDRSVLRADTFDPSVARSVGLGKVADDERAAALDDLRTMQRLLRVTGGRTDAALQLHEQGFTSAREIVQRPTAVGAFLADSDRKRAERAVVDLLAGTGVMLDWFARNVGDKRKGPAAESAADEPLLGELPDYAHYFRSQDYCKCRECQSILGAAAYFVDLMQFIERYISVPNFHSPRPDATHPLSLYQRRRDLWTAVPLTCESIETEVPYLTIILEILENYVAGDAPAATADRSPLEARVYRILYERGPAEAPTLNSFAQPFMLPLERARVYLTLHARTMADIVGRVLAEQPYQDAALARARLELSEREYSLIAKTTRNSDDPAFLRALYRLDIPTTTAIDPFDAQRLLAPMHVSRDELGELLATRFVNPGGEIAIRGERTDGAVQPGVEMVHEMTLAGLDRLHRLTRLWRRLPWSPSELDVAIAQIGAPEGTLPIVEIATLVDLAKRFELAADEVCGLCGPLPTSLFDRLFNPVSLVRSGADQWNARTLALPIASDEVVARVLAGLRIDRRGLAALADPYATTIDALTLMGWYQHSRLAAAARLDVSSWLAMVRVMGGDVTAPLRSVGALVARVELLDRWQRIGLSTDQLSTITSVENASATDTATATTALANGRGSTVFADTTFAFVPGMTEAGSRAILRLNADGYAVPAAVDVAAITIPAEVSSDVPDAGALPPAIASWVADRRAAGVGAFASDDVVGVGGMSAAHAAAVLAANPTLFIAYPKVVTLVAVDGKSYRLTSEFDPAMPIMVPAGQPISGSDATAHLAKFQPSEILPGVLAAVLSTSASRVRTLSELAGFDLRSPALRADLVAGFESGTPSARIVELVAKVRRLSVLFAGLGFDDAAFGSVAADPAILSIASFGALVIADVESAARYRDLLVLIGDAVVTSQALVELIARGAAPALSEATLSRLAQQCAIAQTTLSALAARLWLPTAPVAALGKLLDCAKLADELGVAGATLATSSDPDYDAVQAFADALLAGLHASAADATALATTLDPLEDTIHERRRDALSDYILYTRDPARFRRSDDLYHWFLIDTELMGCARTSRVVAAHASMQLYVQRCLMRLEQSADGPTVVTPLAGADEQWTWRKNFRLWQANRKVFLFPESYLLQSLRDDKTELFEKYESQLLAQQVDPQNVLDTFGGYLAEFAELADARISGAFHDQDRDVLHLFAANRGNPPDHWYRTVENVYRVEKGEARRITWGPWRKVPLQIPVREVAPIVFQGRLYVFWVETATRPDNDTSTGRSKFIGYRHTLAINYTTLRLDGTWTPPQPLDLAGEAALPDPLADPDERAAAYAAIFGSTSTGQDAVVTQMIDAIRNQLKDSPQLAQSDHLVVSFGLFMVTIDPRQPVWRRLFIPERAGSIWGPLHIDPDDQYRLMGWRWRAYPTPSDSRVHVRWRDGERDGIAHLFERTLERAPRGGTSPSVERRLYLAQFDVASIFRGLTRTVDIDAPYAEAEQTLHEEFTRTATLDDRREVITYAGQTAMQVVNGALTDGIFDVEGDQFYLHVDPVPGEDIYILKRLGTTLASRMQKILFEHGVDRLLASDTQEQQLGEAPTPFTFNGVTPGGADDPLFNDARKAIDNGIPDFTGPLGVYFREVFLHFPWRIAEHLNAQGEYELAHRWFRYILDPTSTAPIAIADGASPQERARVERSRIWQYVEFRRHAVETLRDQLADADAIAINAANPFDPHAIARVRLGAYMRGVWMKMCSNLIDWGDQLFMRDTLESINEATLLYVMATDLLGERPAQLGECNEPDASSPRTFDEISDRMATCPQAPLAQLESMASPSSRTSASPALSDGGVVTPHVLQAALQGAEFRINDPGTGRSPSLDWAGLRDHGPVLATFTTDLLAQACAFCIPPNSELLALWDRVDDRLFKIRNCMNLAGERRKLALFAPPIDPALLVRARAAGLSVDDVLDTTSGNLPPYRFSFLIAKAKEYAAALQGFGGALLAAIEKKDAEELARLRMVHEKNILQLTTRLRDRDVEVAEQTLETLVRRRDTVSRRRDHQQMLISQGLSGWEQAQVELKRASTLTLAIPPALELCSATLELIPKIVGMAASTGGDEAAKSTGKFAAAARAAAEQGLRVSDWLGLEATFERRKQGWNLQLELADLELRELEPQIAAQQVRIEMARRSREIHQRALDQLDETFDYFDGKFSNLALYEWLSTTLQTLYRQAYGNAYALLRLAEAAYRFERGARPETAGTASWDPVRAGLLAGDKLMADVRDLERRFMETHFRSMEIDQAFSLSQIDPRALWELKQTGECEVAIPELYLDLFYPGQYRRRIRSARLTIPSITGPYTNVSATLTLLDSKIRLTPHSDPELVPPTRTVTIATSNAQNDAGVFSLDFRDERYMPFEGAGVESRWRIGLPKAFRPFDYATINDVVLHISYTAEYDVAFAREIEAKNGVLVKLVQRSQFPRALSLRQEMSSTFNRLVHTPTGADGATFELSARHFPLWVQGRVLRVSGAWLVLDADANAFLDVSGHAPARITYPTFRILRQGVASDVLVLDETLAGMPAKRFALPLSSDLDVRHDPVRLAIALAGAGDFAPTGASPADPSPLDDTKLRDLILYFEYTILR